MLLPKLIQHCITMGAILATLCSCENQEPGPRPDTLWDFGGYDVEIKIADKSGTNLLNPTIEGGWMDAPFRMVYNGKEYETQWDFNENGVIEVPHPNSRALPSFWYGLRRIKSLYWDKSWEWHQNEYLLAFGQFDPTEDKDIYVEFYVPNKEKPYKISVENRFRWTGVDECETTRRIWCNGKEIDGFPITIVLPLNETDADDGPENDQNT